MKFLCLVSLLLSALLLPLTVSANEQEELGKWLKQVVNQHPRLQAVQAAAAKAKADVRAADQPLFNPEIEFEYESAEVDTKTAGIVQTLDWGDKQSAQTAIANSKWRHSLSELTQQQQQLTADVLLALASFQSSVAGQQVAKKRMDSMTEFFNIAKQRYAAGDLTEVAFVLAQLAQSEATFQQADAKAEHIASKQTLYVLLGDENHQFIKSLPAMNGIPDAPVYSVKNKDQLLDALPQMQLARARMDIARAEIKLRQRQQSANPTIGIKAGEEGDESLTSVTFSMPLFVRNDFSAEVESANAELIQRQREAIDTRRLLAAQLETTAQTLRVNRQAWVQWQEAGNLSLLKQGALLERLWRAGELSTTDYLVQLKQALNTEASAIEHKAQLWQSWTQWLIASGEINQWIAPINPSASNSPLQIGNGEEQ